MKSHYKKHLQRRAKINSLNIVKNSSDLSDFSNTLLTNDKKDGIESLPTESQSPVLYTKNIIDNFPQTNSRNLFHINFLANEEVDQGSHMVQYETYEFLENNFNNFTNSNNNYYLSNNNLIFLNDYDGNNNLYNENLGYFKY
jgi:hypothetical protein